jgi:hypothetical protein
LRVRAGNVGSGHPYHGNVHISHHRLTQGANLGACVGYLAIL